MTHRHPVRILALTATFLPALAFAHAGHGDTSSFAAGTMHPFTGADHLLGFFVVGLLAVRLGRRYLWPATAAFLGLLVAAGTADSDGWRYAAGFMFSGASLIAAGMAATRLFALLSTAAARRSPT